MGLFNNNYDAGFLNVPGFGQSVTNPLAPVFYDSLGVVKDLSVFGSAYVTNSINVGDSSLSNNDLGIGVPANFREDVFLEKNLKISGILYTDDLYVGGKRYVETTIKTDSGTFAVLAVA